MSADKGLLKNSLFSIIARFTGVALNFGVAIILARSLDLSNTGIIFLLMTIVTGVALISRIGVEQLLLKEIASARDDHGAYRTQFLKRCYQVVTTFSLVFVAIWILSGELIQEHLFHNDIPVNKLILAGLGILFFNVIILNVFFMRAIRKTITSVLMQNTLPALTFLVLIIPFWSSLAQNQLYVDLYIYSLVAAGIISTLLILSNIDSKSSPHEAAPNFANIIKKSLPLAPVSLFSFIMLWADTIMVGALLSNDQVALFNTAARVSFVSLFFLGALDATIYPRLLSISKNNPEKLVKFFWLSTLLVIGSLLLVTLLMTLLGEYALLAFGTVYLQAFSALVILLLAQWLRATSLTFSFMFIIRDQVKYLNIIMIIALVINIISNVTLIPRYGIEGAAIATCLANAFLAVGVALLFYKNKLLSRTANA